MTRAELTGAIKALNAAKSPKRKEALRAMLVKEHPEKEVAKVLADLASYPDWAAGADLDAPPADDQVAKKRAKR